MKKVDLGNVAVAAILLIGISGIALSAGTIYGVYKLYQIDSALPGAVALAVIGIWSVQRLVTKVNHFTIDRFREMDLKN